MEQIASLIKLNEQQTQQQLSPALQRRKEELVREYGDRQNFLAAFNPDHQIEAAQNPDRCFFGPEPTLGEINMTYGQQTAAIWLVAYLADLSEYCGCKDKLMGRSLQQCAELIAQRFYWLKVTELMLFFTNFKSGCYGKFYGAVDPMAIMEALQTFVNCDRSNAIEEHERMLQDAQRKKWDEEYEASRANHPEILAKYGSQAATTLL